MGRRKTPPEDALAISHHIVEAAERLFRDLGYVKTTVGDIAKAVGMSQANVYRYFPTKAAINEHICERVVRRIEDRCHAALADRPDAKRSLEAFLMEYHRAVRDNVIKDKRLHEMVVSAVEQYWSTIQAHVERMDQSVRELLQRGIREKIFKNVDVDVVALAFQNACSAFTYPALVERQIADAEALGGFAKIEGDLKALLDILFTGLCP